MQVGSSYVLLNVTVQESTKASRKSIQQRMPQPYGFEMTHIAGSSWPYWPSRLSRPFETPQVRFLPGTHYLATAGRDHMPLDSEGWRQKTLSRCSLFSSFFLRQPFLPFVTTIATQLQGWSSGTATAMNSLPVSQVMPVRFWPWPCRRTERLDEDLTFAGFLWVLGWS